MNATRRPGAVDPARRRMLATAAMTIAAAHLGSFRTASASDVGRPELAALGRAAEWLNYQFYFATERGRAGYEANRREFAKLIWRLGWTGISENRPRVEEA